MKRIWAGVFVVLATFVFYNYVVPVSFAAEDEALAAKGKELFENKEGLNVKVACILCHKDSKALDPAKMNALGEALPDTINKYVVEKAKGATLAKDGQEMKALEAYLRSGQS
ncbi:MAG: hypothetical protein HY351_02625 [Candidatus Omnitrophica bacterium]|nr:hypothetical protein [Candidatus Omnitrophota bacterium]